MILTGHVLVVGEGFVSADIGGSEVHIEVGKLVRFEPDQAITIEVIDDVVRLKCDSISITDDILLMRCFLQK